MKRTFNVDEVFKVGQFLLVVALSGVLLVIGFSGCAAGDKTVGNNGGAPAAGREDIYRVSVDVTPFYRYGPQQPNGPDLSLKKETRLVLLKRSYGYSQVRMPDNQVGFVGTEDISPVTPQELAAERAAAQAAQNPKPSSAIVGHYTIPPEAGSQERLPEPDVKPTPNPAMFRY